MSGYSFHFPSGLIWLKNTLRQPLPGSLKRSLGIVSSSTNICFLLFVKSKTAWQPWYYGWGFNLPRGQALLDKWNQIPDSTDILVTHCPPLARLRSLQFIFHSA
ncbi:hypothetical protein ATANTOWER_027460 [Ataeniobius toweri]|uniref:Uncharacterized protein n=1 Tax=Ataeniobius toweri TaxID=208326 RepID=A0ABU7ABI0_9TELE|nr:hypothetical protein [Ataeniobius toweri]